MDVVERFLAVLASWNHGFQIRIGGVQSEVIESPSSVSVREIESGVVGVHASDSIHMEEHLQAVVQKANLDAEGAFFQHYDDLPEYIRSCLELNYLLVLSTRPSNRWLLAAAGLEALAVGTAGGQETLSHVLSGGDRRRLVNAIQEALEAGGHLDLAERVISRVLRTTVGPVRDHVHGYLRGLGIDDVSPEEINLWWRTRGPLAHGAAVHIEPGELNHLITVFQTALRRTAGAEGRPT